jgi:hypothetical protein
MQRLESTQKASSESFSRSSNLSEQANTLLSERTNQTGGKRELAATSLNLDSNLYGSAEKAGSCKRTDDACSWRPDDSSSSAQTKTWRAQRETQRDKPLDTKDGKYEVKPGDTMNDISKRYLKDLGIESPSAKEIAGLSKMLADQNKEQHSILKCNPNLIRPGMKLELPPADKIQRLWPKAEVSGHGSVEAVPPSESRTYKIEPNQITNIGRGDQTGGEAGKALMCRREDGLMNLPYQFKSPHKALIEELNKGSKSEIIQLPFHLYKDQPGQYMNLPFRLNEDSKGRLMKVEDKKDSGSLKRMLDHAPLPELMLV